MSGFASMIYALFGRRAIAGGYFMLFSMRLDETGTDGRSAHVTVGGAVAQIPQWDALEAAWARKLKPKGIDYFHLKEFDQRQDHYEGWSDFKCRLFENSLNKIIERNTLFRSTFSVDSAAHASVKERMRGIRGFRSESDYSLCLRTLMFWACEELARVDPDCELSVIVEDGPWSAGAAETYQRVAEMTGGHKPAKHAHRLAGFLSIPKGKLHSLDAADFIVGREHDRLVAGLRAGKDAPVLAHLLTAEDMETYYEGMIREKEARRKFGNRAKGAG